MKNYYTTVKNDILSVFNEDDKEIKKYDLKNEYEYREAFEDGWIKIECLDGYYHKYSAFNSEDEVPNFYHTFINDYEVKQYVEDQLFYMNEEGIESIVDSLIFKMAEKCLGFEEALDILIDCSAIEHSYLYDSEDDMAKQFKVSYKK